MWVYWGGLARLRVQLYNCKSKRLSKERADADADKVGVMQMAAANCPR